jgi:hypothetical protein
MNNTLTYEEPRTITIAELCEALANGSLAAQVEEDMYVIRNRDLVRLTRPMSLQLPIPSKAARRIFQKAS